MSYGKRPSSGHDRIVEAMVSYFLGQGWRVSAASCQGYPEPPAVGRHEPDALGSDGRGVVFYGEAKTGDGDIGSQHSREQYHDFSTREMQGTGTPCLLYVCVPKGAVNVLRAVLAEEGLSAKRNVVVLTA
jgi:hypothetical protein